MPILNQQWAESIFDGLALKGYNSMFGIMDKLPLFRAQNGKWNSSVILTKSPTKSPTRIPGGNASSVIIFKWEFILKEVDPICKSP